ncbi:NAD(+) diphosphatase [Marinicauda salina]|nr:NAD(+) diphosphatase [Marinicauda salina]
MPLTFTASPLDHAGLKRTDPDWIAARRRDPSARTILFEKGDLALDANGDPLILHPDNAEEYALDAVGLVFLGVIGETPWFAAAIEPDAHGARANFRGAAMKAEPDFACLIGRARSILAWRGRRRYCSNCAAENAPAEGGLKLECPGCGMEHFPRVDASVIMLPYAGDRCVMGRQANWPEGMFATLAGFMEPGETIEEACAREVMEEIGRPVVSARYVASQPWPFPSSLMIGLLAEIEEGEVRPDDDLEDARWFTRDEARALHDSTIGRWAPPNFSISWHLLQRWLDGET